MGTAPEQENVASPASDAVRTALMPHDLHNWNVRNTPIFAEVDGHRIEIPQHSGVIRDPEFGAAVPLGTVGRRNNPIQNEERVALMMWILGLRTIEFIDAGYTGNGEQVFMACTVPPAFVIASDHPGTSPTDGEFELISVNHHDGGALWFHVVQRGTWTAALRSLFEPRSSKIVPTGALKKHALSSACFRHNASRDGIAGKLRRDLRLGLLGEGPIGNL